VDFEGARFSGAKDIDFGHDDTFRRFILPDLETYHTSHRLGESKIRNVAMLLPRTQNERISAQQGLFLCPSRIGPTFMEQLQELMHDVKSEWALKLIIPRKMRTEILNKLFQMNVNPVSLFPGADGLGKFCSLKAELFGWE